MTPQPARVQNEGCVSSSCLPSTVLCVAVLGHEVVPGPPENVTIFSQASTDLGLASLLALGSPSLI